MIPYDREKYSSGIEICGHFILGRPKLCERFEQALREQNSDITWINLDREGALCEGVNACKEAGYVCLCIQMSTSAMVVYRVPHRLYCSHSDPIFPGVTRGYVICHFKACSIPEFRFSAPFLRKLATMCVYFRNLKMYNT
jgi:hypothetical protein